jgi:hypothetical protein
MKLSRASVLVTPWRRHLFLQRKDAAERATSYTRLSPPLTFLGIYVGCCSMSGHYMLGFDFFLLPVCLSYAQNPKVIARSLSLMHRVSLSPLHSLSKWNLFTQFLVHVATPSLPPNENVGQKKTTSGRTPSLIRTARLLYKFCDQRRYQNIACRMYDVDRRYSWGGS